MTTPAPDAAEKPPLYVRRPFVAGALRQWPLTAVVAGVGAGLVLVALDRWREGLVLVGLVLVGGALLRLALPERRLGFLVVRKRTTDVTLLLAAGLVVAALALAVRHR